MNTCDELLKLLEEFQQWQKYNRRQLSFFEPKLKNKFRKMRVLTKRLDRENKVYKIELNKAIVERIKQWIIEHKKRPTIKDLRNDFPTIRKLLYRLCITNYFWDDPEKFRKLLKEAEMELKREKNK